MHTKTVAPNCKREVGTGIHHTIYDSLNCRVLDLEDVVCSLEEERELWIDDDEAHMQGD
jgi:hypothetical protein